VSGFEKPYEAEGIRKNGDTYPLKLEGRNIPSKGKTIRVVEFRDITEQRDKENEIKYISFHDELTGLYNRRFFEESLVRYDHPRNLPLTIVMGDMNNLKQLNDTYGHAVGDQYLKQAASIIHSEARGTDIVTRWGGDEFVIIMPNADSTVAAKLISRINALIDKTEFHYTQLSVAFGYATKSDNEENIQDMFRLAEKMMYKNKKTDGV
ncbi:MAG: GGDEF domain-containing protein, partial [Firmicutes bacterium]|nr:GGDEF domain-containing protein [Bacillota bacterium]